MNLVNVVIQFRKITQFAVQFSRSIRPVSGPRVIVSPFLLYKLVTLWSKNRRMKKLEYLWFQSRENCIVYNSISAYEYFYSMCYWIKSSSIARFILFYQFTILRSKQFEMSSVASCNFVETKLHSSRFSDRRFWIFLTLLFHLLLYD